MLHGEHAVGAAGFDAGAELVIVAAADEVAGGAVGYEDFDGGVAAGAVSGGEKLLGDDGEEGERELLADLRLVARGEGVEDARDGLRGVVGVERGEDEVAGFGGGEGGGHGFAVAHLADHDDVGILTEDGADGLGEVGSVVAEFDLFDERVAIGVLVLDGIFDGDDVVLAAGVDAIDEGGEGGGFTAAGGSGEKDEALVALGEHGEGGWEMKGFE